ncbi:hypothetical protein [Arthrobacter sp. GMC3]|uniref:hypothetical protein n=1 Tax=Arthrobacter sp. GMC3 TaxID=2058894 RepID=UPI0011B043CC|nr:hypothetical protein [Arthrobacter sp. GMC3]
MNGSLWMLVVAGVFVLVVLVLVGLLVVGRLRGRTPDPEAGPPEHVPYPRGEAIPPRGSR